MLVDPATATKGRVVVAGFTSSLIWERVMIINGTSYHDDTPVGVIRVLEKARADGTRLRVHYGDTVSGRDWMEEHDVTGTVSRSMGPVKIPLLVHNSRCLGGAGVLDHCIVRIRYSTSLGSLPDLYRHPDYHVGQVSFQDIDLEQYKCEALIDGSVHARFESKFKAIRWAQKMGLDLRRVL